MAARPLGHYCAVEPLEQGKDILKDGSLWLPSISASAAFVYGKVLACGRDVRDIRPGDIVVYEIGSGHPSLTWVLEADTFGGDGDKHATLIPCYQRPLRVTSDDMEELRQREERVRLLQGIEDDFGLKPEFHDELMRHSIACSKIMERQERSATNRQYFTTRFKDPGKGRGIIGVVSVEEEGAILD